MHPDPLEFLYSYEDIKRQGDSRAYSFFTCIWQGDPDLKKCGKDTFKDGALALVSILWVQDLDRLKDDFSSFKHRFTPGDEMACLLSAAREMIEESGSLNDAFLEGYGDKDDNIVPAMLAFSEKINKLSHNSCCSLMPSHSGGSAFKRVNLFLRWMIRSDEVDPGGWHGIPPSKLLIPLDIHMSPHLRYAGTYIQKAGRP